MQTLSILTEQNVRESMQQLRPIDVLIQPALGDFSAADFDHLEKAVPFGEAAAQKEAASLSALALTPQAYAALRRQQSVDAVEDRAPVIAAIQVRGNERVNSEAILQKMETKPGEVLDQGRLDLDMRRIFGSGDFESVRPDVQQIDGQATLVVNVTEKTWGPELPAPGVAVELRPGQRLGLRLLRQLARDLVEPLWRRVAQQLRAGQQRGAGNQFLSTLLGAAIRLRRAAAVLQHHAAGRLHRQRPGRPVPRPGDHRQRRPGRQLQPVRPGALGRLPWLPPLFAAQRAASAAQRQRRHGRDCRAGCASTGSTA